MDPSTQCDNYHHRSCRGELTSTMRASQIFWFLKWRTISELESTEICQILSSYILARIALSLLLLIENLKFLSGLFYYYWNESLYMWQKYNLHINQRNTESTFSQKVDIFSYPLP